MAPAVLQGDVAAFRLPDVLTFLSTVRKSGTLTLRSGDRYAALHFADGALVHAGTNQEQFRLGSVLLRRKKISREERDRIDALMQRDGGRFGELAVQERVLTEAQLRDFLKVQVSEIVYDTFVWDRGTFAFEQSTTLAAHAVTIAVDLPNLIMEGARRIEEWEQCLQLLPDNKMVFRVVATPRDEKITLTADEWKILFLINGIRTIEELCHDADDDPFSVYRVLYGLYANKLIEPLPERITDDSGTGKVTVFAGDGAAGDATIRQSSPQFGSESTIADQEANDDTSLLVSSEAHLSFADMVRPIVAQLQVKATGATFALTEQEYLVGRHRDNNIQLADAGVSGFHARIFRGPEGYIIEDLKSRNGTWVNDERVNIATLGSGDRLHLGQLDLVYEILFAH
jgi:hypothetical protein